MRRNSDGVWEQPARVSAQMQRSNEDESAQLPVVLGNKCWQFDNINVNINAAHHNTLYHVWD